MNERSTFTDVDGRRRIVSWWSRGGTAPHRRWIEAQEVDDDTGEWVTRADSGELWAAPGDAKERFLREHVPWFGTRVEKTRGPILPPVTRGRPSDRP